MPIYWLFTGLMLLAMALFASVIAHSTFDPAHIAASLAFIPWPNDAGQMHPVLALGWTLNYEMYFYLLFGLALLLRPRFGLVGLAGLFIMLALINPLLPAALAQAKFWTDPIIVEFLFGIGLAMLRQPIVALPIALCWALVLGGLAAILALDPLSFGGAYERLLTNGIPAALVVAGIAFLPFGAKTPLGRALVLGGDASYALYLSHPFAINIVALLLKKTGLGSGWLFVVLAVIAAIIGAALVHLLIEMPLTGKLYARLQPKPAR